MAVPGKIHHSIAVGAAVGPAYLWHLFALCGRFLNRVDSFLRHVLGGSVVAEEGHFVGQGLESEVVGLGSPELAVAAVVAILVHLCNPDLKTVVAALAILNDSEAEVHLCLVVAGSEHHIVAHAHQHRDTVHWHSHLLYIHVHWVAEHILLCLVAVGLVGRIVDPAACRLLDVQLHKPHLVVRIRPAAVDGFLAYNLAVRNLVEHSLGCTVLGRVRSHCPRHCLCNSGQTAGSCHIHNHRIRRVAEQSCRSLDHNADHNCRIAVAEDSRHSVFAPEPAGADRSMLDAELGRSWIGRTPCCQSNGGESGGIVGMLQSPLGEELHSMAAMRSVQPRGKP